MRALVFVEHHGSDPAKASLGVLAKAAALFPDVAAVVCGSGLAGLADRVGQFGAKTVYVADDAALADPLPQPRVDVLAGLVAEKGIDTVLFRASVLATDVPAGLSPPPRPARTWG